MKIPDAKAAMAKEWGNEEDTRMAADESQKQKKRSSLTQGKKGKHHILRRMRTVQKVEEESYSIFDWDS